MKFCYTVVSDGLSYSVDCDVIRRIAGNIEIEFFDFVTTKRVRKIVRDKEVKCIDETARREYTEYQS